MDCRESVVTLHRVAYRARSGPPTIRIVSVGGSVLRDGEFRVARVSGNWWQMRAVVAKSAQDLRYPGKSCAIGVRKHYEIRSQKSNFSEIRARFSLKLLSVVLVPVP